MRIQRVPRIRREWTDEDRAMAARLFAAGRSNDEIAVALGRKPDAVRAWIHHFKLVWNDPEPVVYETVKVTKADVLEWYEAGWRFVGFDGALCVIEWQSSRELRWPNRAMVAA
jgi:hypothetical protein